MAERWQQWMPHDIDAWQGSANVQALSDLAYRAVHNLILDMWKQDDCALPCDERELSKRSRVAQRWHECKEEVLDYFKRTPEGKLTHPVTFQKWNEARAKYEENHRARSEAGKKGAAKRWDGKAIAQPSVSYSKPMAKHGNNTVTSTETEQVQEQIQKQKPSSAKQRRKAQAKPPTKTDIASARHKQFKAAIGLYWKSKNPDVEMPWGAPEGQALEIWLRESPSTTIDQFTGFLRHRFLSEVNHTERPSTWIRKITSYANEPLDRFGTPKSLKGNHGKPTETALIDSRAGYLERRERRMAAELDNQGGLAETGLSRTERPSLGPPAAPVLEGRR